MIAWSGLSYRIVIPSRRRSRVVVHALTLVPDAYVCIEDTEEADYLAVGIPRERLMLHPPLPAMGAIRQWVLDHSPEPCVFMLDDDTRQVISVVGRKTRKITDPHAVKRIIENGLTLARDLSVSIVGFNPTANPIGFDAASPMWLKGPALGPVGFAAKHVRYDETSTREDLDVSLRASLVDRFMIVDRRFHFDCGGWLKETGGMQGIRTTSTEDAENERLQQRWGRYISRETGSRASMKVQRRAAKKQ